MDEDLEVAVIKLTKEEVQRMVQLHIDTLAGIAATVALNTCGASAKAAHVEVDRLLDEMMKIMKKNGHVWINTIMNDEKMGAAMQQGISEQIKRHMQ